VISTEIRYFVQLITDEGNEVDVPDTFTRFTQNYEFTRILVEQEFVKLFLFFF